MLPGKLLFPYQVVTHGSIVHRLFGRIYLLFSEDKLYVIMEFIEGAPLGEHFNSLKEKKDKFSEERIWNIFVQVNDDEKGSGRGKF